MADTKPETDVAQAVEAPAQDATAPPTQTSTPRATPPTSIDLESSKPKDFDGQLKTNDSIPSDATLAKVADYHLLDKHGKSHTFKSLYNGPNGARRVLVVFIRHFFCGVSVYR